MKKLEDLLEIHPSEVEEENMEQNEEDMEMMEKEANEQNNN